MLDYSKRHSLHNHQTKSGFRGPAEFLIIQVARSSAEDDARSPRVTSGAVEVFAERESGHLVPTRHSLQSCSLRISSEPQGLWGSSAR